MNDDLKAYVDGELPPEAAERLRAAMAADPGLAREVDALRVLSASIRRLPEPEPVGRAATLEAMARPRPSLVRGWGFALAACAAVLVLASRVGRLDAGPRWLPAVATRPSETSTETTLPLARKAAFVRFVHGLGGEVRPDGDGVRAFYPSGDHDAVRRRFLLPDGLPWPTDGLRVRFAP